MKPFSMFIRAFWLRLLMSLCATAVTCSPAYALQSTSYILNSDYSNNVDNGLGYANTAIMQGDVTWKQNDITSPDYQIVSTFDAGSSSSVSSSTSSVGTTMTATSAVGGGRGKQAGTTARTSMQARQTLHAAASSSSRSKSSSSVTTWSAARAFVLPTFASGSTLRRTLLQLHASALQTPSMPGGTMRSTVPTSAVSGNCPDSKSMALPVLLGAFGGGLIVYHSRRTSKRSPKKRRHLRTSLRIAALLIGSLCIASAIHPQLLADIIPFAHAEQTLPAQRAYNGHLLDNTGKPITTSHTIRFSYWSSASLSPSDFTSTGAVNTSASHYLGWTEEHTVTPDKNGYFSVILGSIKPLPDPATFPQGSLATWYLEVDVKAADAPSTSYETLAVDPANPANTRSQVLPVPLARDADLLDQHDTGTGSGNIPVLGTGGLLSPSEVPGGTTQDSFTLDSNDTSTGSVSLRFGRTLGKAITYSIQNGLFTFNDSVKVQGDLTVTGLINGVDISSLGVSQAFSGTTVLHAAFDHASYVSNGTNDVGQLSVSHDDASGKNYYEWNSTRPSLQEYDIVVRLTLPQSFEEWKSDPLSITYRSDTTSASDNKLNVQVFDTAGNPVSLSGATTDLTGTGWTLSHIAFAGSPNWTPGQDYLIRLQLFSSNEHPMDIGDIRLMSTDVNR